MIKSYTPKQIEKYKRQKYINLLTKCTKNLFRLFRSDATDYQTYKDRFALLKKELDDLDVIRLDSEHSRLVTEYIEQLYKRTVVDQSLTPKEFEELKSSELTQLNRLQKLKNQKKYTKTKHKNNFF
jgi:hypothetical protein